MAKRKRLTDLYVQGKLVVVDDGSDDPVEVWLQKMNPAEAQEAMHAANAHRSVQLAAQHDHDGDIWLNVRSQVEDFSSNMDDIVLYLSAEEIDRITRAAEAEMAAEDEWVEKEYLSGLRDAWEALGEKYEENPEDPDAKRVHDELERFSRQVHEHIADDIETVRAELAALPREVLIEKCCERFLQIQADVGWINEYRMAELYLAVRDPEDHNQRYFVDRAELGLLQAPVLSLLLGEMATIEVDVEEGKD